MNKPHILRSLTAVGIMIAGSTFAENPLRPIMCVADKTVLQDDFSKAGVFDKKQWAARQGTQWKIEDGVLRGRPSTPEHQASVPSHKGLEPRIAAPVTPPQFIAKVSVRFSGGSETDIAPFVEFGHHVCRVRLSSNGAEVLAGPDATRVAEAKDFHYEPGKWYQVLAEMQGDEFVIQIAGGPTIYAKNAIFAQPAASGADGLGVAGPRDGIAEIDDVMLASVKPGVQPGWAAKRDAFPKFAPVESKPARKKAKE